jgi:hypothetical protein
MLLKRLHQNREKIELLDSLGFRPIEIARLLNKSPHNVNVQLSIIRNKKEKVTKLPSADKVETGKSTESTSSVTSEKLPEG